MNATPSRFGVLSDSTLASALGGVILVIGLFLVRHSAGPAVRTILLGVSLLPLVFSVIVSFFLRNSRNLVVDWLVTLPFPVDNFNAILAGTSDGLEIVFAKGATLPDRAEVQPQLDKVSDDILFITTRADERMMELKLGIIDSKRVPLRTNHARYLRFVQLVERVLVPLARSRPIALVRVA